MRILRRKQFEEFSAPDQEWIRFVLSAMETYPGVDSRWDVKFNLIERLAVSRLKVLTSFADEKSPVLNDLSLAIMIEAGLFSMRYDICLNFYPFRFLNCDYLVLHIPK